MATKSKVKAVTGANAQTPVAKEIKTVVREARQLGWHDYKKANKIDIITPKGVRFLSSYNKETKKHTAYFVDIASGKWIGLVGVRQDGSDIYMKTELASITAEAKQNEAVVA